MEGLQMFWVMRMVRKYGLLLVLLGGLVWGLFSLYGAYEEAESVERDAAKSQARSIAQVKKWFINITNLRYQHGRIFVTINLAEYSNNGEMRSYTDHISWTRAEWFRICDVERRDHWGVIVRATMREQLTRYNYDVDQDFNRWRAAARANLNLLVCKRSEELHIEESPPYSGKVSFLWYLVPELDS